MPTESIRPDQQTEPPVAYVVDDDESLVKSISQLLQINQIPTRSFTSANRFLEEFDGRLNAVIICDYLMPEMNGLQVQKYLNDRGIRTPIIFLSGNFDVKLAVSALKKGAATVIEKPFLSAELVSEVKQAFERGKLETEKRDAVLRFSNVKTDELIVLKYLVAGLINKQIASRLGVSERTVERRKSAILSATDTSSIFEALELARLAEVDLRFDGST